jgi:hypothetical protein
MRINWRGVRGLALGGLRDKLDFSFIWGRREKDWKRSSEAATLVCTELLMQGERGIACCSLFPSSESITKKTVVNERLMTKQCENTYTQLALYRCWDTWRVSTAV